jgi:hypothetical protein
MKKHGGILAVCVIVIITITRNEEPPNTRVPSQQPDLLCCNWHSVAFPNLLLTGENYHGDFGDNQHLQWLPTHS